MKHESSSELLARQFRELEEFIKDNPTDVAQWPNPFKEMNAPTLTPKQVEAALCAVADEYGIYSGQLSLPLRDEVTAEARMMYWFLLRVATDGNVTMKRIGQSVGKDHSAVWHSTRKAVFWMKTYPALRERYDRIVAGFLERTDPLKHGKHTVPSSS